MTEADIIALGYYRARHLSGIRWLALSRQLFTCGLCIVDEPRSAASNGQVTRFCYEYADDAKTAFDTWDGVDDPPGPWIVQKPEQRYGPGSDEPAWVREGIK